MIDIISPILVASPFQFSGESEPVPIPPSPIPSGVATVPENRPGATHTEYQIERVRSRNEGICASAIAGGYLENCSLVRLHSPIEYESIYWNACRHGAPPIVPGPECLDGNFNRVFLGGQQSAIVGVPAIEGHVFCMAGVYHFVIVGPEGLGSNFRLGKMPWELASELLNFIPSTNFINSGIIDNTWNQPIGVPLDADVPLLQNPIQG